MAATGGLIAGHAVTAATTARADPPSVGSPSVVGWGHAATAIFQPAWISCLLAVSTIGQMCTLTHSLTIMMHQDLYHGFWELHQGRRGVWRILAPLMGLVYFDHLTNITKR